MPSVQGVPMSLVQSALRRVTETLGAELGCPSELEPRWSELEWRLAPAVAAMHGVASLLARSLRWVGPNTWQQYLAAQHQHTRARQERLLQLVAQLGAGARERGLPVMALKGAALQARGLYALGERPMADLDLLIRSADLEAVATLLRTLGYRETGVTWKHRSFEPLVGTAYCALGEATDNPINIDVHVKVGERLPLELFDITDALGLEGGAPGVNYYRSTATLMLHVLAHMAGSMVSRAVRLIQLNDIARLCAVMRARDWHELSAIETPTRRLWWAYAPLQLTARYFPGAVPGEVLERAEHSCPSLLRRVSRRRTLSEVSYSHAFVDPLPGIAWARSGGEMLRYVVSRVHPDGEQLAKMRLMASTGPWASAPQWYAKSQLRRIGHWALSRPVRAETLLPVRAALGDKTLSAIAVD